MQHTDIPKFVVFLEENLAPSGYPILTNILVLRKMLRYMPAVNLIIHSIVVIEWYRIYHSSFFAWWFWIRSAEQKQQSVNHPKVMEFVFLNHQGPKETGSLIYHFRFNQFATPYPLQPFKLQSLKWLWGWTPGPRNASNGPRSWQIRPKTGKITTFLNWKILELNGYFFNLHDLFTRWSLFFWFLWKSQDPKVWSCSSRSNQVRRQRLAEGRWFDDSGDVVTRIYRGSW